MNEAKPVRETKEMDISLTHEELILDRRPVIEPKRTDKKPVETRTEIKIPLKRERHVVCTACGKGILTVIAEVGIESEGSTEKFQSLSAAHGRVYKCNVCERLFVNVDNEFLELR